jgi:hypothetical protein
MQHSDGSLRCSLYQVQGAYRRTDFRTVYAGSECVGGAANAESAVGRGVDDGHTDVVAGLLEREPAALLRHHI